MAKIISKQVYRHFDATVVDVLIENNGMRHHIAKSSLYSKQLFGVLIHSIEGDELQLDCNAEGKIIRITNTRLGFSMSDG